MSDRDRDSGYKSKAGPIPERWFAGDHDPDPERLETGTPEKERDAYIERLRASVRTDDKTPKR